MSISKSFRTSSALGNWITTCNNFNFIQLPRFSYAKTLIMRLHYFLLGSSHLDNQPKLHIFNLYLNFKELPKQCKQRCTAVFRCFVVCFVWDKTDTTHTHQKGQPLFSFYFFFFHFFFS